MHNEEKKYYSRHLLLEGFGEDEQQKLTTARVLVIGAGGLGCPVAMYLTGAGVGNITLMDYDTVDASNLPRQLLYTYADIGKPKAQCAEQHLKNRNPFIHISSIIGKLTVANALEIFKLFDVVVDGSDNFSTRYLVNDACVILNKSFVSGSVVGFEGQVSVFNYNNGPTYRCLYPEPLLPGESPSCSDAGVLNTLTGWAGSIMAQETLKLITGTGQLLSGRLAVMNALDSTMHEFAFKRGTYFPTVIEEVNQSCENTYQVISYDMFQKLISQGEDIELVDVREEWEMEENTKPGSVNIPLADIPQRYTEISKKAVAFTCNKGERSRTAASWVVENLAPQNVYVVENQ